MRTIVAALVLASAISVFCCQSAGSVAIDAMAINEVASTVSAVQQVRYHRHYIVKCYYELVVGPYRCHRYYRWW